MFKLAKVSLEAGEANAIRKRHPLRADATTYKLYSGTHELTVMANGRPLTSHRFELIDGPGGEARDPKQIY